MEAWLPYSYQSSRSRNECEDPFGDYYPWFATASFRHADYYRLPIRGVVVYYFNALFNILTALCCEPGRVVIVTVVFEHLS